MNMRIKFNAKSALADAKFSYDRDRNLNVKKTMVKCEMLI